MSCIVIGGIGQYAIYVTFYISFLLLNIIQLHYEMLDYCPCPTVICRIAVRFPRLVPNSVVTRLVYLSLFDPFTCVSRLCAPVNRLWAPAPAHYRRFFTLISKVYLISVRPCGSHTVHSSDLIFSPLVSTRASLKRTGTRQSTVRPLHLPILEISRLLFSQLYLRPR